MMKNTPREATTPRKKVESKGKKKIIKEVKAPAIEIDERVATMIAVITTKIVEEDMNKKFRKKYWIGAAAGILLGICITNLYYLL